MIFGDFLMRLAVMFGVFITVSTEFLSLFSLTRPLPVFVCWMLFAGVVIFFRKSFVVQPTRFFKLSFSLLPLAVLCVLTLAIALAGAPNTWDSMTYHMSRVANWFSLGSVARYPTHIERQAFLNPWAEYAVLHFYTLLAGNDRLANIVQWISFAGTGITVYLIAGLLGATKSLRIAATAFFLSIPMAVLQATSTQNDLVCAFWCTVAAYFALKTILHKEYSFANSAFFSLALAIAVLAKGVALFYGGIIALWWTAVFLRRKNTSYATKHILLAVFLVTAINLPHAARNLATFHNLFTSPQVGNELKNSSHSPALLLSSVAKNTAIHFRVPHNGWNNAVMKALVFFHRIIGVDINDPRTTWGGRFALPDVSNQEDQAGNPLHAALLAVAFALVFLMRMPPGVRAYAGITIGGFLAFCFFLKWQPWHSRLHLPFFALSAPVFAVVFDAALKKFRLSPDNMARATTVVVWGLSLAALPWVFFNYNRPFFSVPSRAWQSVFTAPREEQYFAIRKDLYKPYREAADALAASGCTRAGLVIGGDDWEYPLWPMMRSRARGTTFTHVLVANATTRGRAPEIPPGICAILHVNGSQVRLQQIQSD